MCVQDTGGYSVPSVSWDTQDTCIQCILGYKIENVYPGYSVSSVSWIHLDTCIQCIQDTKSKICILGYTGYNVMYPRIRWIQCIQVS